MPKPRRSKGRRKRGWGRGWILAIVALIIAFALWGLARVPPEHLPWTALDLSRPPGLFTGRKLAALDDDPRECRALLTRAAIDHEDVPMLGAPSQCPVDDALRLGGGARKILFRPRSPAVTCPVGAALALWEQHVLQPEAQRLFGQRIAGIDHLGSYNCRRMYGRNGNPWSEHARANALDIAGFRLADGTRIDIRGDWEGAGRKSEFLRAARDGACGLFATVLSPDYNAAHADHLHLDQATRGTLGWRACR